MTILTELQRIYDAGRPLIEESVDISERIADLRDAATEKGIDWSQVKALLKAQILDERDETGSKKRIKQLLEKADHATAYADMLGLGENVNEKNFFTETDETPQSEELGEEGEGVEQDVSQDVPAPSSPALVFTDEFGELFDVDEEDLLDLFESRIESLCTHDNRDAARTVVENNEDALAALGGQGAEAILWARERIERGSAPPVEPEEDDPLAIPPTLRRA